jgi:pyruvate,water dikinase
VSSDCVLWLDSEACRSPAAVGNKCARLAILRQGGHIVPDGFAVTASCLRSGGWEGEVAQALIDLAPPWVVRSSSTAEDSGGGAFAGIFATVAGLADPAMVLAAVEEVGTSIDGIQVTAYARARDIDPGSIEMGVLVQTLVEPSVAGVAFSRDPVTGAEETVIEANYGLGETVVDGSVVPDGVRLGIDGEIINRRLGRKTQKAVFSSARSGLERVPTSLADRKRHALSDREARRVGKLTRRLEVEIGEPADVEWAFVAAKLYLLQCRPITSY